MIGCRGIFDSYGLDIQLKYCTHTTHANGLTLYWAEYILCIYTAYIRMHIICAYKTSILDPCMYVHVLCWLSCLQAQARMRQCAREAALAEQDPETAYASKTRKGGKGKRKGNKGKGKGKGNKGKGKGKGNGKRCGKGRNENGEDLLDEECLGEDLTYGEPPCVIVDPDFEEPAKLEGQPPKKKTRVGDTRTKTSPPHSSKPIRRLALLRSQSSCQLSESSKGDKKRSGRGPLCKCSEESSKGKEVFTGRV